MLVGGLSSGVAEDYFLLGYDIASKGTVQCRDFGPWRIKQSWRMGLLGVVKWRGVGVICLERQCDKVNCTYGSGED
jgi:hypothetical protein